MFHHDIDGPVLPVAQCDIGIEKVEAAENGDISNMSVDEYLTWVQRQASELPGVVRVDVPTEASTKDEDYPTACEATDRNVPEKNIKDILEYTGNDVWKRCMLQEFEEFRESFGVLHRQQKQALAVPRSVKEAQLLIQARVVVPALKARDHWFIFCFGRDAFTQWCERCGDRNIFAEPEEAMELGTDDAEVDVGERGEEGGSVEAHIVLDDETEACIRNRRRALEMASNTPAAEVVAVERSTNDNNDTECGGDDNGETCPIPTKFDPNSSPSCVYPSVALLLQIDHVMTQRVLGYLVEWLEGCVRCDQKSFCYRDPSSDADAEDFNRKQAEYLYTSYYYAYLWLFALLTRIEKPLHKDSSSVIRILCKLCIELRFLVVEYCLCVETSAGSVDGTAAATASDTSTVLPVDYYKKLISMLNILIVVSGVYFGQGGDLLIEEEIDGDI